MQETDIEDEDLLLYRFIVFMEHFSLRELTIDGDAINALSGVIKLFSKHMGTNFLHGFPVAFFDYMLIFAVGRRIANGSVRLIKAYDPKNIKRRHEFPSWSWAGWTGSLDWPIAYDVAPVDEEQVNLWLIEQCWIQWHLCDSSGCSSVVSPAAGSDTPKAEERCDHEEHVDTEIIHHDRQRSPNVAKIFPNLDFSLEQMGLNRHVRCLGTGNCHNVNLHAEKAPSL